MDAERTTPLPRMYKNELAKLLGYTRSNQLTREVIKKNLLTVFTEKTGQQFTEKEFIKSKQISPALGNFLLTNL